MTVAASAFSCVRCRVIDAAVCFGTDLQKSVNAMEEGDIGVCVRKMDSEVLELLLHQESRVLQARTEDSSSGIWYLKSVWLALKLQRQNTDAEEEDVTQYTYLCVAMLLTLGFLLPHIRWLAEFPE